MTKVQGGLDIGAAKSVAAREDEGHRFEVMDEFGDPLVYGPDDEPVWMEVVGSYSTRRRKAVDKQRRNLIKQGRKKVSAEQLFQNQIELDASCVLHWGGFFDGDKVVECNPENAAAVLLAAPWILEQAQAFIEDHEAFTKTA